MEWPSYKGGPRAVGHLLPRVRMGVCRWVTRVLPVRAQAQSCPLGQEESITRHTLCQAEIQLRMNWKNMHQPWVAVPLGPCCLHEHIGKKQLP